MNERDFIGKAMGINNDFKLCSYVFEIRNVLLFSTIASLAESVAIKFGKNWRNKTTYTSPTGVSIMINSQPHWLQEFSFQQKDVFENAISASLRNKNS